MPTYDWRYVGGLYLSALERALSVAMTPAADALFPATALYDGRPAEIAKFGSNPADCRVDIDTNLIVNGGFESGGTPPSASIDNWTDNDTGNGASTNTATGGEFVSGARGLKLDTVDTAGVAERYQDVTVRAGERLTFRAQMRKSAAGSAAVVGRILNRNTGQWLTSGGAWSASASDALSTTGTSFALQSRAFTVESLLLCQGNTVTLRVLFRKTSAGAAAEVGFVDDVEVIPDINFASVHGHNIDPLIAVQLRSSSDNFAANDVLEATLAMRQPSFGGILASVATARRYWRLKLAGTNTATPYLGELLLGYIETAIKTQQNGWTVDWKKDQARNRTGSGELHVAARGGPHPRRVAQLQFVHPTEAGMLEVRDSIVRRTAFGEYPMVLMPVDSEDVVMFGRLTDSWQVARQFKAQWDDDLMFEESPFPLVTG